MNKYSIWATIKIVLIIFIAWLGYISFFGSGDSLLGLVILPISLVSIYLLSRSLKKNYPVLSKYMTLFSLIFIVVILAYIAYLFFIVGY